MAPNRSKFVWFFSIAAVFLFLFGVVVGCAAATRPEAAVAPLPWHLAFFSAGAGPDGAVASFFFPLFRDGACDRLESFSMSSPSASGPEAFVALAAAATTAFVAAESGAAPGNSRSSNVNRFPSSRPEAIAGWIAGPECGITGPEAVAGSSAETLLGSGTAVVLRGEPEAEAFADASKDELTACSGAAGGILGSPAFGGGLGTFSSARISAINGQSHCASAARAAGSKLSEESTLFRLAWE